MVIPMDFNTEFSSFVNCGAWRAAVCTQGNDVESLNQLVELLRIAH